jgi:hypothetical protein
MELPLFLINTTFVIDICNKKNQVWISIDYCVQCPPERDAMYSGGQVPTFWRNLFPASSGQQMEETCYPSTSVNDTTSQKTMVLIICHHCWIQAEKSKQLSWAILFVNIILYLPFRREQTHRGWAHMNFITKWPLFSKLIICHSLPLWHFI